MTLSTQTASQLYALLASRIRPDGTPLLPGLREACEGNHIRFDPEPSEQRQIVQGRLATCNEADCPGYTVREDFKTLLVALKDAGQYPALAPRHDEFQADVGVSPRRWSAVDNDPERALLDASMEATG